MSLTLNDEQEKALRAWWNYASPHQWVEESEPYALVRAIAPLMKPWRIERFELGWNVLGHGTGYNVRVANAADHRDHGRAMVQRLADLLNESEAKR